MNIEVTWLATPTISHTANHKKRIVAIQLPDSNSIWSTLKHILIPPNPKTMDALIFAVFNQLPPVILFACHFRFVTPPIPIYHTIIGAFIIYLFLDPRSCVDGPRWLSHSRIPVRTANHESLTWWVCLAFRFKLHHLRFPTLALRTLNRVSTLPRLTPRLLRTNSSPQFSWK